MNERLWELLTDSFWQILIPGLTMTIPLTVISFALAMVIAVVVALIQFANIQGLKQIARFYIWVIRGTPLLVQLFLVFYGLPDIGIVFDPFPAAVIVFSINEAPIAPRRCARRWKRCRSDRLRRGAAWACRTCRSCGASCCRRRFARRSRR